MNRTWSGEADGHASGLEDLFGHLDATAAAGREAGAIRADRDPRIPKLEHVISYDWHPPPSRDEIRKKISGGDHSRHFNRTTKHCGDLFSKVGILRHPKSLNNWETDRIVNAIPERSIGNPPGRPGLWRYHPHSKPFEEPTEKQLHPQHRKWLKQHHVQRDNHVQHVYRALKRVEKLQEKANEVQQQRETARDLMTRPALMSPHLNDGIKAKLHKAKMAITSTRNFNKICGIDKVGEDEKEKKDNLIRAQSAPCLQLKPLTPRHRARHLRTWKGPERRQRWCQTDECLKHTTPGLAQEEEHELHNIPRYRARGA